MKYRDLEATLQRISDVGRTPIYILDEHDAARVGVVIHSGTLAMTCPVLDVVMKNAIGDHWQGRGFCMLLNSSAIYRGHGLPHKSALMLPAIHEMAHALVNSRFGQDLEANDKKVQSAARIVCEGLTNYAKADPWKEGTTATADPWQVLAEGLLYTHKRHDARFLRTALHLCHRLIKAGHDLPDLRNLVHTPTHPAVYLHKLLAGGDMDEYGLYLDSICRFTTPPKEFTALWERDLRFLEQQLRFTQRGSAHGKHTQYVA